MVMHDDWVRLRSNDLDVEIDPLGAQLSALRDTAARSLLWDGNASVWSGRAPLLFPIVGVLNGGSYRLGADRYPLPRHGFARGKRFSIQAATDDTAVLRLTSDADTLTVYPFRFELDVLFEVRGATLSVTTRILNSGIDTLLASFGYHPALRWPLPFGQPRDSHFIEFETDEPAPVRRIDPAGLLTPIRHPTPIVGRRLALTDALFRDDVLILDRIESRSVVYGADHGPRIRMSFPDAKYLGLWTKPGAEFICIEPWHGITDHEGFTDDFAAKEGVFRLAPGEALSAAMTMTVVDG